MMAINSALMFSSLWRAREVLAAGLRLDLPTVRSVAHDNAGNVNAAGNGLFEMRVHHEPGYRLSCLRGGDAGVVR